MSSFCSPSRRFGGPDLNFSSERRRGEKKSVTFKDNCQLNLIRIVHARERRAEEGGKIRFRRSSSFGGNNSCLRFLWRSELRLQLAQVTRMLITAPVWKAHVKVM